MKRIDFTHHMAILLIYARSHDIPVIADWVKRDYKTQQRLVKEGKSKTLNSMHLRGKAIDLYITNSEGTKLLLPKRDPEDEVYKKYKFLGDKWEDFGEEFTWGGNFDEDDNPKTGFFDPFHFQVDR